MGKYFSGRELPPHWCIGGYLVFTYTVTLLSHHGHKYVVPFDITNSSDLNRHCQVDTYLLLGCSQVF